MTAIKVALAVGALALVGVGAGLGVHALVRPEPRRAVDELVPATIGGLRLTLPLAYLRDARAPREERLDLVLRHPEMRPGRGAPTPGSSTDPRRLVFVAVTRADGVIDPADRPQDLYGRFLEPDAWRNPGGLVLRRFQAGSPYEDEELYLAPPDGRAFAARCRKSGREPDGLAESCLWRLRIAEADIQVRFAPELLPEWETLSTGLRERFAAWAKGL